MGKRKLGKFEVYLISLLSIGLWGLSYIWSDRLLRLDIPVEYIIFVRAVITALLLFVMNVVTGASMKIRKKDFPMFMLLAACEPLIYFLCETYGIKLTESPTYSALIISTNPIVAFVAGMLFFGEKINLTNVVGVVVCVFGIGMFTMGKSSMGPDFIWGVILLVVAVVAEVGQASFTKALSDRTYSPMVIVMYQFVFGAAFLFPVFLASGLKGYDPLVYNSWDAWSSIICLALFCSTLAFSLWVTSIKYLGVAKSSIFQAMIPVATALANLVLNRTNLTVIQWAGIGVAVLGVILSQSFCEAKKA